MIFSPRFSIILDANVLYPAPIRDILLSLAAEGLFKPKWTQKIHEEWIRNLTANRPELSEEKLWATVDAMNQAFPDAMVEGYEELIDNLVLPDLDDRHVLASAIRINADIISTFNLKDFPKENIEIYDLEIQHPNELINNLLDLDKDKACTAFSKMVGRLKNPKMSKEQVLESLKKCGLTTSVKMIKKLC